MGKAVLVMDMPSSCDMCDLIKMVNGGMYCGVKGCGQCAEDYIVCRPDWCPLRELPQKKELYLDINNKKGYCEGYNACIDELLKGVWKMEKVK